MTYEDLVHSVVGQGSRPIAVVMADEENVLRAAVAAAEQGIARPILLGERDRITGTADAAGVSLTDCDLVHVDDPIAATQRAADLARGGDVAAIMKGRIPTARLMRTALESGLRRGERLLSHVTVFEHERLGRRLALFTDGALIPFPTKAQKIEMIRNAVGVMRALGTTRPRTALLSPIEEPTEKIPESIEAAEIAELARSGGPLEDCAPVEGPMDLFSAFDSEAARIKGLDGGVAGRADIVVCPNIVAGNLMGKALLFFGQGVRAGGCIVGGRVPIVMLSRASSARDKLHSIVLALGYSAGSTLS